MEETFDGLCALVNKRGVCYQCAGFRDATAEDRRRPTLPDLGDDPWSARLDHVRSKHVVDGVSMSLHELLARSIKSLESQPES
ncbi:MAG: hypothetical protein ACI9OJ_005048 [Myxococcota bacterium]|jgi:hypothetical protein